MLDTMGSPLASCYLLVNKAPKDFLIEPECQGRGVGQGSHVKLVAMFFGKENTLNTKLVKMFKPGSCSSGIKGRVGSILVELGKLLEHSWQEQKTLQGWVGSASWSLIAGY